jgi:hypothetical protein
MTSRFLALVLSPLLGGWLSPAAEGAAASETELDDGAAAPGAEAEVEAEAPPAAEDAAEDDAEPAEVDAQPAATVVDVVLPCGLRVITAKDASLPVAAVVLAVEIGTRDDPDKLPGLVHALAYHLQQGNRELAPGEAIATAHDVGGLAGMAVGPAQVRFESLVPISQLDAQLRVEALRLRAPNTGRELWLKSLSYARNDSGVKVLVPREAAAAAWQDPGIAHDGRVVVQALGDMLDQAVGAQLSRLYDYRRATLVVVGPDEPQALFERVEPLFAGLSARPRKQVPAAQPPPAAGAAPRVARVPRQRGDSMVWAVPGNPAARAWAQVLCGTLNRQRRVDGEPAKARLRCTYSDDPRRPLLLLRAIGYDPALGPEPLIANRLARVAAVADDPSLEPDLAALVEAQRARIETDMVFDRRTPLELATHLASASERRTPKTAGLSSRPRAELLGLPLLPPAPDPPEAAAPTGEAEPEAEAKAKDKNKNEDEDEARAEAEAEAAAPTAEAAIELLAAVPDLFDTRRAVLLLGPDQEVPPPVHDEAPASTQQPAPAAEQEGAGSAEPKSDAAPKQPATESKPEPKPDAKASPQLTEAAG